MKIFKYIFLKFNIMFGLTIGLLPQASFGEVVLIQANTNSEFQAFIAVKPEYISYSNKFLKRNPSRHSNEALSLALAEAQRSYLNESLAKAESDFEKLIGFSYIADWNLEQRKTIVYAYLRRSQLEKYKLKRNKWIRKGAYFSMGAGADSDLFPENLIKKYKNYQKKSVQIYWTPSKDYKRYRYIIVNGKKFLNRDSLTLALPSGKIRLSLISDTYLPESHILKAESLKEDLQLKKVKLVEGLCEAHKLHSSVKKINFTVFFNEACIKNSLETSQAAHNSLKGEEISNFRSDMASDEVKSLPILKKPSKILDIVKNKWVWVGMGIIATSFVKSRRKVYYKPTTKKGF